jgi:wyosine [tRNA(Phe)-imidazoG37] synthetase (radical SAM superfamily)
MKMPENAGYKHIFGPVPSRRLGRSLGIDLVPHKICTLNCVYCECGKTTLLTPLRSEYVPRNEIFDELDRFLKQETGIDVITLAGSGEPTLNSGIGDIVAHIKKKYSRYPTALLTNGTLLHLKEVRDAIANVDLVLPSLDAVSESVFKAVNRPAKGVNSEQIIRGLQLFSEEFHGRLWIEVFIVPGINDTPDELRLFKEVLATIRCEKIQLNSLDRPGACSWVKPAGIDSLNKIAEYFKPLPVEIIARGSSAASQQNHSEDFQNDLLATLRRRPCTMHDLKSIFNIPAEKIMGLVMLLEQSKQVVSEHVGQNIFYRASSQSSD